MRGMACMPCRLFHFPFPLSTLNLNGSARTSWREALGGKPARTQAVGGGKNELVALFAPSPATGRTGSRLPMRGHALINVVNYMIVKLFRNITNSLMVR